MVTVNEIEEAFRKFEGYRVKVITNDLTYPVVPAIVDKQENGNMVMVHYGPIVYRIFDNGAFKSPVLVIESNSPRYRFETTDWIIVGDITSFESDKTEVRFNYYIHSYRFVKGRKFYPVNKL